MPSDRLIGALETLARTAARRQRLNRVLRLLAWALPLPLTLTLAALTFVKIADPEPEPVRRLVWIVGAALALSLLFVARPLWGRRSPLLGALALDRHFALQDRITSALSFAAVPFEQRTPLMRAAIDDAECAVGKVKPAQAVPWRWPSELALSGLLLALLLLLSRLEVSRSQGAAVPVSDFTPVVLWEDDLALVRENSAELLTRAADPEVTGAVQRFNQLVEDLAEHRLDRREVFRRLEQLEKQSLTDLELDREALDEGLEGLARELEKSGLSKPAAKALEDKRLADAEQALRALAARLKQPGAPPDRAALEELRKALEQASQESEARLQRLDAQRSQLEEEQQRLLKRKQEAQAPGDSSEQALQQSRRQLERLKRERSRAEKAKQQLSELDRELAKAAREVFEQLGQAAESLEAGASEMGRAAQQQLTQQQKLELKRQLEQLRDLLRQQGKGGKEQQERLRQFGNRARGGKSAPGGKPGAGKGDKGQGGRIRVGIGSEEIEVPGGAGNNAPGGPGEEPGGSSPASGPKAGKGLGPELQGEASALQANAKDVSAAGVDSGQGSASSEVVFGAAERGFTSSRYREIYTDYHTVAEEVIGQDEIPPGYKFYVRRYFQLIRPRE